jgi:hypothetical protein
VPQLGELVRAQRIVTFIAPDVRKQCIDRCVLFLLRQFPQLLDRLTKQFSHAESISMEL